VRETSDVANVSESSERRTEDLANSKNAEQEVAVHIQMKTLAGRT